jgi:precorrin-2/cobalt-factor-2 C20-methyltransferase
VEVDVVPGITAMQAIAAASRVPLVEGTEVLALVPVTAGLDVLEAALDLADTVVAYKAGRRLPEVLTRLRARPEPSRTVLGTDVSLPTQQLTAWSSPASTPDAESGDAAPDGPAPYFSTILHAPARPHVGGRL